MTYDSERLASWVYQRTMSSEQAPPGPGALLERLVGGERVTFVCTRTRARLRKSQVHVEVRRQTERTALCMELAIAVVLSASMIMRVDAPEEIERIAAAIVMPKAAVRLVMMSAGHRPEAIARAFVVPVGVVSARLRILSLSMVSGQYPALHIRDAG